MPIRRIAGTVGVLASLVCGAAYGDGVWPGPAPCDTTLQACIDGVASYSIIRIATNGPIAESVQVVDKVLWIENEVGFTPVFGPTGEIAVASPTTSAYLILSRLHFRGGGVVARGGMGDLTLGVVDSTFVVDSRDAVSVSATGTPLLIGVSVTGSSFNVTNGPGFEGAAVKVSGVTTSFFGLSVDITDNVIFQEAGDSIGAVSVFDIGPSSVNVMVRRNEIHRSGNNTGILIREDTSGAWRVLIQNNLIVGSANTQGAAVRLDSQHAYSVFEFQLVGNTIVEGDQGILLDHPGDIQGVMVNNIVANFTTFGFDVNATDHQVVNRNNLFSNAISTEPLGPSTLQTDPLFVGGGNYRLQAGSPARNAGANADLPNEPTELRVDLDSNPRVLEGIVDLGAYERGISVLEIPTLSEVGLTAMVGLLLAAGMWALRRRAAQRCPALGKPRV